MVKRKQVEKQEVPAEVSVAKLAAIHASLSQVQENPDLLKAYIVMKAAQRRREEAHNDLGWIADEWRHKWPLAPEELLDGANADHYCLDRMSKAERDIIGRYIKRDVCTLTKRLSPKFRRKNFEPICFSVLTLEELDKRLEFWATFVPKAKGEKALAEKIAGRDRMIAAYRHKRALAEKYWQETEALRREAGVAEVEERISNANREVAMLADHISKLPAYTSVGLRAKAEAIDSSGMLTKLAGDLGIFGEMARFIESALDIAGKAAA